MKVWGEEKEVTVGAAAAALARGGGGKGVVAGRDELGLASAWSQSRAMAGGSLITMVGAEPAVCGRVWVMVKGSERRCAAWAVWVETRSQREERSWRS